jgi:hypothetical protein
MPEALQPLRQWHRLFGLLLTDFFTDSPFTVEVERDLSEQQQLLDVIILRRGRGRIELRLPDGLRELAAHNLITFKSHHESLDAWAIKELIGHFVAYRKLVSRNPSALLPEDDFRLYAVCARFPSNLSRQIAWHERQAGVYDCQWGTDIVRIIVAGQLPREAHNAPLQLFSASPELVGFASSSYQKRSERTSRVLSQLFEEFQGEGLVMPYTMEDFEREYAKKHFPKLTPKEQREALELLTPGQQRDLLKSLPPEERLAGLSADEIRTYLDQLAAGSPTASRKQRKKRRTTP